MRPPPPSCGACAGLRAPRGSTCLAPARRQYRDELFALGAVFTGVVRGTARRDNAKLRWVLRVAEDQAVQDLRLLIPQIISFAETHLRPTALVHFSQAFAPATAAAPHAGTAASAEARGAGMQRSRSMGAAGKRQRVDDSPVVIENVLDIGALRGEGSTQGPPHFGGAGP